VPCGTVGRVTFHEQLSRSWQATSSLLCVGLDPDPDRLPDGLAGTADATYRFCREIVDATADVACAFKPQIAYFASQGEEHALERLCSYIRAEHPHVTLVLDAKRGDIGSTAEHYAREAFVRYGAHAVTVNPYLGTDSALPFFEHGGGVIALCRTSNPGGSDLQDLPVDGRPLYLHVAEMVAMRWARHGDCALVTGATYPDELAAIRAAVPDLPFLVPGIGAQGGDAAAVAKAGCTPDGHGLLISSSRAILYASSGADFADAARQVAIDTRDAARPPEAPGSQQLSSD
jgi:orotidine-5'-phosphate decarboxylase